MREQRLRRAKEACRYVSGILSICGAGHKELRARGEYWRKSLRSVKP